MRIININNKLRVITRHSKDTFKKNLFNQIVEVFQIVAIYHGGEFLLYKNRKI